MRQMTLKTGASVAVAAVVFPAIAVMDGDDVNLVERVQLLEERVQALEQDQEQNARTIEQNFKESSELISRSATANPSAMQLTQDFLLEIMRGSCDRDVHLHRVIEALNPELSSVSSNRERVEEGCAALVAAMEQ